jgi:hypothetical protein
LNDPLFSERLRAYILELRSALNMERLLFGFALHRRKETDCAWILAARQRRRFRSAMLATSLALFVLASVSAVGAQEPAATPCKVNVNTATAEQLAHLPGIGPKLAARIADTRSMMEDQEREVCRAPWRDIGTAANCLIEVPGVGPKTVEGMAPHLAIEGPTTCTEKQRKPKAAPAAPNTAGR